MTASTDSRDSLFLSRREPKSELQLELEMLDLSIFRIFWLDLRLYGSVPACSK
jgi:hypothetical protein